MSVTKESNRDVSIFNNFSWMSRKMDRNQKIPVIGNSHCPSYRCSSCFSSFLSKFLLAKHYINCKSEKQQSPDKFEDPLEKILAENMKSIKEPNSLSTGERLLYQEGSRTKLSRTSPKSIVSQLKTPTPCTTNTEEIEPVEELETRVTFLQQSFVSVTKDIETLEEKVKRAKALKEELNELCQLQDYLSTGAIDETKQKIDRKRKKLENLEEMLLKAKKIQGDIKQKENDPDFMTDAVLISTTEKIEKAKQALKIITAVSEPSLNEILQEKLEARKELECVVCHDVPKAEVFSCKEQHILCLECKYSVILSCPICRQNFVETPPIRNRLAERIIQKFKWNVRNKNS